MAVPMVVWLVLTTTGVAGLSWIQRDSREAAAQRFAQRIGLMGDFVTGYVTDVIDRERAAGQAFLANPGVGNDVFTRTLTAFGYPAALLLDDRGRVIQVAPDNPALVGRDMTGQYAHLRTAVAEGHPAVSGVVRSATRGVPVVGFAVPFDTGSGRRVFSGAMDIRHNQLSSYLATALSLKGVRIQLVDTAGAILAANRPLPAGLPTLPGQDPALAAALRQHPTGRYEEGGRAWRYASLPIPGTPWQLSAAVREDVMFASLAGSQLAGRVAVATAALVGLLVVGAVARSRHSWRDLQQAHAQMADFLAMLTHDVRQPLGTLVAVGELMLEEWPELDEDAKRRYVRRMTSSGHRAGDLVGEILTLAQLDAGALVARPIDVDVTHSARQAVAAFGADPARPIAVVAPDECTALADPAHLQLILGNLLSNATKYGAPPVTVSVAGHRDRVEVRVSDNGEGVPDAFVPQLFSRFSRAEIGVATTKPGTGLGLYFVRQLATANGLAIDYQPNQPHGAVFTLTLPVPSTPATGHHAVAPVHASH
ncbi:MAG TPA: sensor histidine kinase [Rugosimonospora sp.]|nr:sensor histidine kinase [Rugosimonospora sp.]